MNKDKRNVIAGALANYRLALALEMQHPALDKIGRMLETLSEKEKWLVEARYLSAESEYTFDSHLYQAAHMSGITYSKIRASAFTKLQGITDLISPSQRFGQPPILKERGEAHDQE
ncbi:hypothetical protein [Gorillibacterium timonense]|uniref:hypothetical protein n=1 Tax=Gorillibacterium timonense TaxID=1689269 RepID=UPI00071D7AFB|nr:hypothetical protein [Gorillibacterium timonense]